MGLGGFFKKVGKGGLSVIRHAGKAADVIDALPGGKNLLLTIPIAGPWAKLLLEEMQYADDTISSPGSGKEKLALVLRRIEEKLGSLSEAERRQAEVQVENLLSALKGNAEIAVFDDES